MLARAVIGIKELARVPLVECLRVQLLVGTDRPFIGNAPLHSDKLKYLP